MATLAAITALATGLIEASKAMGSSKDRKLKEKELKEKKKQRKMDFISKGLDRDQVAGMDQRKGSREIAQNRAQVLSNMAQSIRLGGRSRGG